MNTLTSKQAAFVDNFLQGQTQSEAYSNAGYAGEFHTLYAPASRLLNTVRIQSEIGRRRSEQAKVEGLDLASLVSELLQNGREARELKQMAASTQAFVAAGKALGLIIDKHEIKSTRINVEVTRVLDSMSPEERELAASKVSLEPVERVLELPQAVVDPEK